MNKPMPTKKESRFIPRRSVLLLVALALLALAAAGLLVTGAIMVATRANPANATSAGSISLNGGTATSMFTITGMNPGDTSTKCITLTNNGSLPVNHLSMYGVVGGSGLASYLQYDVDLGNGATGGATFSCTGFTASTTSALSGTLSGWPTSSSMFTDTAATPLAVNGTRSYRIKMTLPSNVATAAQNTNATFNVSWVGSS